MRLIYHHKRRVLLFSLSLSFFFTNKFFFFWKSRFILRDNCHVIPINITLMNIFEWLWILSILHYRVRITFFLVACSTHTRIENHAFEFMKFEKKSLRIDKHDTILVTFLKIVRRNYWEKEMMLLLTYIQFDLILHTLK